MSDIDFDIVEKQQKEIDKLKKELTEYKKIEKQNNIKDDMQVIEDMISATGRVVNKYYVDNVENPGWCIRLESDDAHSELVLTFDSYGRLNKML